MNKDIKYLLVKPSLDAVFHRILKKVYLFMKNINRWLKF